MSTTEQELQRRLDASRAISAKEREIKAQRHQQKQEQLRQQQIAHREAQAAIEAKDTQRIRSAARAHWTGDDASFEKAIEGGLIQRIREDELLNAMRNRQRITSLD